jgi:hypothetical protein
MMSVLLATLPALVRPLFSLGLLATAVLIFRPMLIGLLRAGLLVLQPRQTFEQRHALGRLRGMLALSRMSRELEESHPGMAAEFRALAARA